MKIAYCTPSLYIPGGVERVLTTKANYLAEKAGYEVYIILTDGKGKDPYYALSPKVRLIQLDLNFEELWHRPFWKKILLYLKKQRRYKKALTETLLNIRPDITVSLLRREINFITGIQDGSKKVGELHITRSHYRNFEDSHNPIKKFIEKFWMKSLVSSLQKLDAFVVLNPGEISLWPEIHTCHAIPNPLSFTGDQECRIDSKSVIAVGRYAFEKGFDDLLKAWKIVTEKHPDWKLKIYGGGDRSDYVNLAETLGIGAFCELHGPTPDIRQKYCESSIYVLSSRFEGFGMVLIEAMSCGLPCVSYDCPCGPRNIITNNHDGFLVPHRNIQELAEKILLLIEDEAQRIEMGKNAKASSRQYSEENIMKQWIHLFENL